MINIFYINKEKCHFLNSFFDADVEIVTYKKWRKAKRRWEYVSEEKSILETRLILSDLELPSRAIITSKNAPDILTPQTSTQ